MSLKETINGNIESIELREDIEGIEQINLPDDNTVVVQYNNHDLFDDHRSTFQSNAYLDVDGSEDQLELTLTEAGYEERVRAMSNTDLVDELIDETDFVAVAQSRGQAELTGIRRQQFLRQEVLDRMKAPNEGGSILSIKFQEYRLRRLKRQKARHEQYRDLTIAQLVKHLLERELDDGE